MSGFTRPFSLIFLALVALTMSASARPGGKHGRIMHPKHFDRLADELKIDDTMRAALRTQLDAARAQAKDTHEKVRAEKEKLRALMQADTPDRASIMAQIDRIGALKVQSHKLKVTTMLDLSAALSPEQRTQLRAKMEARRARHRARRGHTGDKPCDGPPEE